MAGFFLFLKIPNRCASAADIVFHSHPKGENHVNNNRRADGKATGVNKKQADVFYRHVKAFAHPFANAKYILLNQKLGVVNRVHAFLKLHTKVKKSISKAEAQRGILNSESFRNRQFAVV